ncbi:MAG: peptidoglycan-associated lipoprotein, partial [Proteobacteria bacterium]|nr:peptidoglycan-associated lipoprotein [Pseudomonadota bacterium]
MRNSYIALAAVTALAACASKPAPAPIPGTPAPTQQAPSGPVPGSAEEFRVTVGDRIFFGYDRFYLTPE